jgi:hypothetical protein
MEKVYPRSLIIALIGLLFSCNTPIMTPSAYEGIRAGTDITQVKDLYGPPYDVKELGNGQQQYRYIHRVTIAPDVTEQTTYLLYVVNGKVVGKQCCQNKNNLDFNASN